MDFEEFEGQEIHGENQLHEIIERACIEGAKMDIKKLGQKRALDIINKLNNEEHKKALKHYWFLAVKELELEGK